MYGDWCIVDGWHCGEHGARQSGRRVVFSMEVTAFAMEVVAFTTGVCSVEETRCVHVAALILEGDLRAAVATDATVVDTRRTKHAAGEDDADKDEDTAGEDDAGGKDDTGGENDATATRKDDGEDDAEGHEKDDANRDDTDGDDIDGDKGDADGEEAAVRKLAPIWLGE
ncbi:uncharacterized protein LOC107472056 [Arachis duranensis]|uniref:Uncharacterized protein LOC107472056 n=1 Tax=Arachis duranensis TaxID=130453 RepID=A0A6P4C003_ARADU|nr:uncharacterized protein LOC107472056 [Arachis duranensis]